VSQTWGATSQRATEPFAPPVSSERAKTATGGLSEAAHGLPWFLYQQPVIIGL
jgi:hypothetical protein